MNEKIHTNINNTGLQGCLQRAHIAKFVWPTSGPHPCVNSGPVLAGSPAQNWHYTLKTDSNNFLWPRCGPGTVKWLSFIDMAQIWPRHCKTELAESRLGPRARCGPHPIKWLLFIDMAQVWPRHCKTDLAESRLGPRARCGPETGSETQIHPFKKIKGFYYKINKYTLI